MTLMRCNRLPNVFRDDARQRQAAEPRDSFSSVTNF